MKGSRLSRRTFLRGLVGGAGLLWGCAPVPLGELERGKDLSPEEKRALIERYAPILWFHEEEYFLPVSVGAFFQRAKVIWRRPDGEPFSTLDSLEEFNALLRDRAHRGENVFESSLDLEPLGMGGLEVDAQVRGVFDIRGQGPEGLREAARKIFASRFPREGPPSSVPPPPYRPKIYARVVGGVELENRFLPAGLYDVVQYFFFFVYNDYWNQHEGDWDATVQVLVRREGGGTYITNSFHYEDWIMGYPRDLPDFRQWLGLWPRTGAELEAFSRRTPLLPVYRINTHPMVFVAKGGHGAYPTPGFALFEGRVPKITIGGWTLGGEDLIAATDERVVGRVCLAPQWGISKEVVGRFLVLAGVRQEGLEYIGYTRSDVEVLSDQPWLGFRGLWGERVKKAGWSGPPGPNFRSKWDLSDLPLYNSLLEGANHFTHLFQKISRFSHDIRETDKGES